MANVGVNIVEGKGVNPISGVSTSVAGLIGTFLKGPLNKATLVTSMAQFERLFGAKPAPGSKSYYAVKAFFAKVGTGSLYIVRVASSSALAASATLEDRQSSPANTLKISAKSEGIWGNAISVKVIDHHVLSTTLGANVDAAATSAVLTSVGGLEVGSDVEFDNGSDQEVVRIISIDVPNKTITWTGGLSNAYTTVNGSAQSMEFAIEVYYNGVLVETHTGLSMNDEVSFFVEKVLVSDYIIAEDLKATDTDYEDLPEVLATPTALASGADGLSDVTASDYQGLQSPKTGVYAFDDVEDLFRFCCPYPLLTDAVEATAYKALVQSMLDYADTRNTVQYYADVPYSQTPTQAVTFAGNFEGRRLAMFYPWLKVIEKSLEVWLPPSSFAMGIAVEKDARRGVHKNPGNEKIAYAIDVKYPLSTAEGEACNNAGVCAIRKFAGKGIPALRRPYPERPDRMAVHQHFRILELRRPHTRNQSARRCR